MGMYPTEYGMELKFQTFLRTDRCGGLFRPQQLWLRFKTEIIVLKHVSLTLGGTPTQCCKSIPVLRDDMFGSNPIMFLGGAPSPAKPWETQSLCHTTCCPVYIYFKYFFPRVKLRDEKHRAVPPMAAVPPIFSLAPLSNTIHKIYISDKYLMMEITSA